jgi:Zn-dependent peptidase ImmA (M78 family)
MGTARPSAERRSREDISNSSFVTASNARSAICHELAHCFLGHECTPPLTSDGERARDGGVEAEANYLAGALLMTNEAAIHVVKKGLISVAQELYGVSRPMLDYRLRVSGTAWQSLLAQSADGVQYDHRDLALGPASGSFCPSVLFRRSRRIVVRSLSWVS